MGDRFLAAAEQAENLCQIEMTVGAAAVESERPLHEVARVFEAAGVPRDHAEHVQAVGVADSAGHSVVGQYRRLSRGCEWQEA